MYIKDEHPLRYRTRYYEAQARNMSGMGVGPEIVVPAGTEVVLQQSSPPLEGLMTAMTDTYTTLVPTMAPLSSRADLQDPPAGLRQFTRAPIRGVVATPMAQRRAAVRPVEMGEEEVALSGYGRPQYTREDVAAAASGPLVGVGFGTCLGCR